MARAFPPRHQLRQERHSPEPRYYHIRRSLPAKPTVPLHCSLLRYKRGSAAAEVSGVS